LFLWWSWSMPPEYLELQVWATCAGFQTLFLTFLWPQRSGSPPPPWLQLLSQS
jgi:hypothetical protein